MSGLVSSNRLRATFIAALLAATAIGGCGGGTSDTSGDQEPAETRIGGGKITTDQLEEPVSKRGAVPRPGK